MEILVKKSFMFCSPSAIIKNNEIALQKRAHIQTGWGGGVVEIKNVTDLSLQDAAKALAMLRLLGAINKTPVSK